VVGAGGRCKWCSGAGGGGVQVQRARQSEEVVWCTSACDHGSAVSVPAFLPFCPAFFPGSSVCEASGEEVLHGAALMPPVMLPSI